MKQLKDFRAAFILLVLLTLAGCGTLSSALGTPPTPAPKSPSEALAAVDMHFQGMVATAHDLAAEGILRGKQALEVKNYIDSGNKALEGAWAALVAGENASGAQASVVSINKALNAILVPLVAQYQKAQAAKQAQTGGTK